ncbi:MAG TPA: class I SAM-dependent methyltransferase [Candidatus Didemnitutus sp.]|nr:class I SAM-dependent methyltransferase [Candidatus Didemnitutus sp.]
MDHRQHFYDQYTSVQSRFASIDDVHRRVAAEHRGLDRVVRPFLPTDRSARMLDLGCGYGAYLLFLQKLGFTNIRGIDLSMEQVELARSLGLACVEVEDLFSALQHEQGIGCVSMFDVIEHLTRVEAIEALKAIHSKLAPGGSLLMRTPNVDARHGTVLSFGDLTHEMHLNKASVLELFASLPYSAVDVYPIQPDGGGIPVSIIRAVVGPLLSLADRITHAAQGISWSTSIKTPNMLIVARR